MNVLVVDVVVVVVVVLVVTVLVFRAAVEFIGIAVIPVDVESM